MPVMTTTATHDAESSALYPRWLEALPPQCREIPEELLALFWEAAQDNTRPTAVTLREFGCDETTAEAWQLILDTRLIDPSCYEPFFDAEDQVADGLIQRSTYAEKVQATTERLALLDHEIGTIKTYALLSDEKAREVAETLQALDAERVALLREQERDFPRMAQILRAVQAENDTRLQDAKAHLRDAYEAHVQRIEAAWREELLALLDPVCAVLQRTRQYLDVAFQMHGADLKTCGSAALRETVLRRLR